MMERLQSQPLDIKPEMTSSPEPPPAPPSLPVRIALIAAVPLILITLLTLARSQIAAGRQAVLQTDHPLFLGEAKTYLERIRAKHSYVFFDLPDSAEEIEFAVCSGSAYCELLARFRIDPTMARAHARKWLRDPELKLRPIDPEANRRWKGNLRTRLGPGFEVPWFDPGSIHRGWSAKAGAEVVWFDEENQRFYYHSYAE